MANIDGPIEGHVSLDMTTANDYLTAHKQACANRRLTVRKHLGIVEAEINHGRWIVPCKKCNGAGFASRLWELSCCFDCGTVYGTVKFPLGADAIEKALGVRPRENRNWLPTETVDNLRQENSQHKVGGK